MNERLLILVLSNNQLPWRRIYKEGALPTWISHSKESTKILTYTGQIPSRIQRVRESITGRMRHNDFVHIQRSIDSIFSHIFKLKVGSDIVSKDSITQLYPEIHSTIGVRTLSAFSTALKFPNWEFLWRANVSNYVNVESLNHYVRGCPSINFAGGVINQYQGSPYLSGAGYLLSRDVVEKVVEKSSLWDHTLLDDVSLGLVLSRMDIQLTEIPRISFTNSRQISETDLGLIRETPSFRCNGGDNREEDVRIMQKIHDVLCGRNHLDY